LKAENLAQGKNNKHALNNIWNGSIVHSNNLDQNVIGITEDRLRLYLLKYQSLRAIHNRWQAPLATTISFGLPIVNGVEFKEKLLVSSSTWEAVFYIFFFLSSVWLLTTVINILKSNNKMSIDSLIWEIKGESLLRNMRKKPRSVDNLLGFVHMKLLNKQARIVDGVTGEVNY
jgi:hypothetical protein